jgi:alpha-ketoglutaric semialdehyde dehydrogenase
MPLNGEMFIGHSAIKGSGEAIRGVDAASAVPLEPAYGGATAADLERACALASAAFDDYRARPLAERAAFIEAIAEKILAIGDDLIERAMAESGLPRARLEGERGRTVGQLRMFAQVVRDGAFLGARIDPAQPERKPLPRVDLRLANVPLGPVAVFGASNFPLAFSVAGGDTASALAAGCPAVVKAHPAHPGTSELIGRAVRDAAVAAGLPEGVFSLLFLPSHDLAQALVADPRIKAVGFTGSRNGGLALLRTAQQRPEPIPVYAEMSSINPVVLMPGALEERADAIAKAFAGALTLGAGQFCTNPGLVLAVAGPGLDRFIAAAQDAVQAAPAAIMLTPGIRQAYEGGVAALAGHDAVETAGRGEAADNRAQAGLFVTDGSAFLASPVLHEEIFGASSLIVRCADQAELLHILEVLEGQLTASVHAVSADYDAVRQLMPVLERKVGRILFGGFGTGVEVGHAMVHGGPFPSTSDSRTTSVGSLAIDRFLRPVSYQDVPDGLLPPVLQEGNPLGLARLIDGAIK